MDVYRFCPSMLMTKSGAASAVGVTLTEVYSSECRCAKNTLLLPYIRTKIILSYSYIQIQIIG